MSTPGSAQRTHRGDPTKDPAVKTVQDAAPVRGAAHPGEPERARARRVLILRSCRAAQFAAAVRITRERHPEADIVALSHRGHRQVLQDAGVDTFIEIAGRRFGLWRLPPWTLARLRAERFDEVVVPQMTGHAEAHLNVYWLVAALRFERVVIRSGEEEPDEYTPSAFRLRLCDETLSGLPQVWDAIIFLALLSWAVLARRRVAAERPERRRHRVLHVISSLGVGGAQRQLAEVVNRTPPHLYDVEVVVLNRCGGDFSRAWLTRDDVRVTFLQGWPRLVSAVIAVYQHCRDGRYDVVHTWVCPANAIGVAGARLAGTPRIILSVRSMSVWKRTWYAKWWYRPADVLCARAADVVTVNARALVGDHAAWAWMPARRIEVVHNGLDPSRVLVDRREARRRVRDAAGVPENTPVIGISGRLAIEKDHATFLRLIREVRRVRPDVHGIIIGDGPLRGELEAHAAALDISNAVTFLGERQDARQLMAGVDVFLLTSLIEGFPNVLLEAAFLGVPAFASEVGGNGDALSEPSALFTVGAEREAAWRVLAALSDPGRAAARAERERQRALVLFSADRMVGRWLALYERG